MFIDSSLDLKPKREIQSANREKEEEMLKTQRVFASKLRKALYKSADTRGAGTRSEGKGELVRARMACRLFLRAVGKTTPRYYERGRGGGNFS